jgi:hypothetical protein
MTRRSVFGSALAILVLAGCGGDGADAVREQVDADLRARLEAVDRMIAEGKLPPIARNVRNLNGTLNVDFIDGPNGDNDVVRTRGSRGKKLVWDLDQNGKIDESERTITERELYDATLGIH